MTTASIPSPFNFGDFEVCSECRSAVHFIEADYEEGVERYSCDCGAIEYEEPIIEN